jgi:hypothetical protein
MDQDTLILLFESTKIPYRPGKRQKQWHQVRFFGHTTPHSLNLGYSLPDNHFVADFVFKAFAPDTNKVQCEQFSSLFGGEIRADKTVFTRLLIPFADSVRLIRIIHGYWAVQF